MRGPKGFVRCHLAVEYRLSPTLRLGGLDVWQMPRSAKGVLDPRHAGIRALQFGVHHSRPHRNDLLMHDVSERDRTTLALDGVSVQPLNLGADLRP